MPLFSNDEISPATPGRAGTGQAPVLSADPRIRQEIARGAAAGQLAAQRKEAERQKQQAAAQKEWVKLADLDAEVGMTYQGLMQNEAKKTYDDLQKIYLDNRDDQAVAGLLTKKRVNDYKAQAALSKQIDDGYVKLRNEYRADPELNHDTLWQDMHKLQFREDGSVIPPMEFDQQRPAQLLDDPKYYNQPVLYKRFADQLAPKQTTVRVEGGRPGQFATSYSDEIRFFERNPDGSLFTDPKTGKPRVKVTDELLNLAMGNARIRRDIEGAMQQHKALETSAQDKMSRYEPLTPEEREALDTDPTLKDLLGQRLSNQGYANHSVTRRYVAPPRTSSSGSGGGWQRQGGQVVTTPITLGMNTAGAPGSAAGIGVPISTRPFKQVNARTGQVKDYEGFGKVYDTVYVQQDGQDAQQITNNTTPQDYRYHKPVVMMVTPSGNLVRSTNERINKDPEKLARFYQQQRTLHPDYEFRAFMQATPLKGKNSIDGGDDAAIAQAIGQSYAATPSKQAGALTVPSGSTPRRTPTAAENASKGRKLSAEVAAYHLIPLNEQNAAEIDADMNGALAASMPSLQREISRYEARTRPIKLEGRGPAAGRVPSKPAAPSKPASKSKTTSADPYGFNF